ncbi:hypothetical protein [Antrihabitans cavernicola]|uniref:Cupin n=1 Tax=Antrihabitans cavernicola TaxID=2495913 RepID=A0A5A7S422_9NOCA|nr:hypothetical protein [Spelaeibacter cavernicola]KAA0020151.1 hypothetical protein FOY51_21365 [Spelaeibacter cavernicola]
MSNDSPAAEEQERTVLVEQHGVTCWKERVPSSSSGVLHRDPLSSITVVLSGGPVEILDEHDRLVSRTRLMTGQVIRGGELPTPYRLHNLADRDLVLVVIHLTD